MDATDLTSPEKTLLQAVRARAAFEGFSKTSAHRVCTDMQTLARLVLQSRETGDLIDLIQSGQPLMRIISSTWGDKSPYTVCTKVSSITSAIKHASQTFDQASLEATRAFWGRKLADMTAALRDKERDNVQNEREAQSMLTFAELDTAISACDASHSNLQSSQERLWLIISRHVPAKRSDWGKILVVDNRDMVDPDTNAILVPSDARQSTVLILNQYKTATTYGQYEEVMPTLVAREIRTSLENIPRSHLFLDSRGRPWAKSVCGDPFAMWVKRVFTKHVGRGVTVNGLRKSWVRMAGDPSKFTLRERDELARRMNHTSDTQANRYFKLLQSDRQNAAP